MRESAPIKTTQRERAHHLFETVEQREERLRKQRDRDRTIGVLLPNELTRASAPKKMRERERAHRLSETTMPG